MTRWRRAFAPGGTFFLRPVTERRTAIFATAQGRALLGTVMQACQQRWPFEVMGIVLLPVGLGRHFIALYAKVSMRQTGVVVRSAVLTS